MAAPTFVDFQVSAFNSDTTPKDVSVSVTSGDILVAVAALEGYTAGTHALSDVTTLSGSTSAWAAPQHVSVSDYTDLALWSATATGTGTVVVRFASIAGNGYFGGGVYVFGSSDGVGASNKANTTGAPSLSLTTTQDNSAIVVINGDWNAADGTLPTPGRTWRTVNSITPTDAGGNGYEKTYFRDATRYSVYSAYYPDAGTAGAKTVGLSAPSGQQYAIAAIEVKGTAGGEPPAPDLTAYAYEVEG